MVSHVPTKTRAPNPHATNPNHQFGVLEGRGYLKIDVIDATSNEPSYSKVKEARGLPGRYTP